MIRGKENIRNRELGGLINITPPQEVQDFMDAYIIDILERNAQFGDLKQMLREAYILGLLHGSEVSRRSD